MVAGAVESGPQLVTATGTIGATMTVIAGTGAGGALTTATVTVATLVGAAATTAEAGAMRDETIVFRMQTDVDSLCKFAEVTEFKADQPE